MSAQARSVRRPQHGRDIKPDAALKSAYAEKLLRLVTAMHRSAAYWLLAEYRRQLPRVEHYMAQDASPAVDMLARLKAQLRRQRRIFDEKAQIYAEWFTGRADAGATARTRTSLGELLGTVPRMGMTRNVNNVLQAVKAENVNLISDLAAKYFTELEGLILRSVREGRDIAGLTRDLEERFGICRRRALLIARDQNNKASAAISRARMQDAGITEAVWRHSGRAKHPRQSHVNADGTIFPLDEGCLIDGDLLFPGEAVNCGCTAAPYMPRANARSEAALARLRAAPGSPLRRRTR